MFAVEIEINGWGEGAGPEKRSPFIYNTNDVISWHFGFFV